MKILVIDNDVNELQNAKAVIERMGFQCQLQNPEEHGFTKYAIDKVDAVLVDFYWRHRCYSTPSMPRPCSELSREESPWDSMEIIQRCLAKNKPFVLVTGDKNGERLDPGATVGYMHEGSMGRAHHTDLLAGKTFSWIDSKNWEHAMQLLCQQLQKEVTG